MAKLSAVSLSLRRLHQRVDEEPVSSAQQAHREKCGRHHGTEQAEPCPFVPAGNLPAAGYDGSEEPFKPMESKLDPDAATRALVDE